MGHELKGHSSYVSSVCYSPDGKTLASGSEDEIVIWDAMSGECISVEERLPESFQSFSSSFRYDGSKALCVDVSVCNAVSSASNCYATFYNNAVVIHHPNT